MDVGYSGTPLTRKLGIKPASTLAMLGAPADIDAILGPLPAGVRTTVRGTGDVTLLFLTRAADLVRLKALRAAMPQAGALWVCWPKKASGVATDVSEDVIRAAALAGDLVDVKVCAVSPIWSGLKLVIRLKSRR